MGQEVFCDLCGKVVPTQDALQEIKIGDEVVAEACVSCRGNIRANINARKLEIWKLRQQPSQQPAEQEVERVPRAVEQNAKQEQPKQAKAEATSEADRTPAK